MVLFGSHRAPAIPPEFYQWREEGDVRSYENTNGSVWNMEVRGND